jgi:hypothetical protein
MADGARAGAVEHSRSRDQDQHDPGRDERGSGELQARVPPVARRPWSCH